jgi:hypothetical protein
MSRTCGAPVPEAHDGCGKPGSHHERRSQSGQRGQGLDQPAAGTRDVARPDRVDRGHQQDGQRRHDNGGTKTSFGDLSSAVSADQDEGNGEEPSEPVSQQLGDDGRNKGHSPAEDGDARAGESWPGLRANEPSLWLGRRLAGGRHDLGPIGTERSRHTAYRTTSPAIGGSPCRAALLGVGVRASRFDQFDCLGHARRQVDGVRCGDRFVDHFEVVELAGRDQNP